MRRTRFESAFGLACVALVLGAALCAARRDVLRAHSLRWGFLRAEPEKAKELFLDLYRTSPGMARELMVDLHDLEVGLGADRKVLVRNPHGHRVYVTAFLDADLCRLGRPGPPSSRPLLRGTLVEAGQSADFSEIVRIGCRGGRHFWGIPLGGAPVPAMRVGGGSISGCFGYADGSTRRSAVPRRERGNDGGAE